MTPDYPKSLDFLKFLYPRGPWMLTAISVDKKSIEARTFDLGEDEEVTAWLQLHSKKNLYYSVNQPVESARQKRKLSKADVHSAHFLHVDVDPRAGEDVEAEQARIKAQLEAYPIKPTITVFSGGGYNALWRLSEPVPIADGASSPDEAVSRALDFERRNWQLELDFQTPDHCRDVSRILRLPFTINRPNEEKIKKGRVPALSFIANVSAEVYALEGFMATPMVSTNQSSSTEAKVSQNVERIESLDHLSNVPDKIKVIIAQGYDPENPKKWEGDRSAALYFVCCELVRCGVPDAIILGIITDSRFLISASVLDKGASIQRYSTRQLTNAKDHAFHPKLAEMNQKYAVIANYGGKLMIMIEDQRKGVEFLRKREFFDGMDHEKLAFTNAKGKEVQIGIATWWFSQLRRRQFNHVVFEPGLDTPDDFNLWRGFSADPTSGDLHLRYLDHMFENICSGVQENYDYLIRWMARVVQTPRTQSMVAPVLLGDRGTGKSIFANFFGALFGRHAYIASDIHELTGRFNSHLSGALFVLGEEAFDIRDKRHESVLKERITGQTMSVEKKGVDIIQMNNYIHLMLTSNNERVIPAGDKERRFFVMRVKEKTHTDDYFLKIIEDRKKGGVGNLLHHLLSLDLSGFRVTQVPHTAELREQQEHNIPHERDWLLQKLESGLWMNGQRWEGPVIKQDLHNDYLNYSAAMKVSRPMSLRAWGLWMRKEFPMARDKQLSPTSANSRPWAFVFPSLEICREHFLKSRGWKNHDWPTVIAIIHEEKSDEPVRKPFE
jgi:hypothetical protein